MRRPPWRSASSSATTSAGRGRRSQRRPPGTRDRSGRGATRSDRRRCCGTSPAREELLRACPAGDHALWRRRQAGLASERIVAMTDRPPDRVVAVDPHPLVVPAERRLHLVAVDATRAGTAHGDRRHDAAARRAVDRPEPLDPADRAGVRGEPRRDVRRAVGLLPGGPRVGIRPLSRVAHAGEPPNLVGRVPAVPDVLDAVAVATVGRCVEGLDHVPAVRRDLMRRRPNGLHPSRAVGAGFAVVPDVRLVGRSVTEIAVAVATDRVVLDVVGRVRPGGDRLCLHGGHRPRCRYLAEPEQVVLEVQPRDQALDAAVRVSAAREVHLDRAALVREAVIPDGVGLRDEHPRPVVLIRDDQVVVRTAPAVTADERAVGPVDAPVARPRLHGPGVAGWDRADQRAAGMPDPQAHRSGLRAQMHDGAPPRQPDADLARHRRTRHDLRALVEVPDDPLVRPPHPREAVRTPLRHADTMAVARPVERERGGRGRGRCERSERHREQQGTRQRGADHPTAHTFDPIPRRFADPGCIDAPAWSLSGPVGGYSAGRLAAPYGAVAVASVGTLVFAIVIPSGTIAPAPRTHPDTFASAPTFAPGPTIEARMTASAPTAAPACSTLSSTMAPSATRASTPTVVRAPSVAPGSTSAVGAIHGASYVTPSTAPARRSKCACRYFPGVPRSIQYVSAMNPYTGWPASITAGKISRSIEISWSAVHAASTAGSIR